MPHLTLEHSVNLELARHEDFELLLFRLHHVLADTAGVDLASCKSRVVCHQTCAVGGGDGFGAFVHLEVRLIEGRSPQQTAAIGQALLDLLIATLRPLAGGFALQITVELVEIRRASYFKAAMTA